MGRNTLKLETKGFEEMLTKLDELNGDLKSAVSDALQQAGETVSADTLDAMKKENMPSKIKAGLYWTGATEESVLRENEISVVWSGMQAEVGMGFAYGEQGAGGILITGTPRQRPVSQLEDIYSRKKYMRKIQEDMISTVNDYIVDKMGEG